MLRTRSTPISVATNLRNPKHSGEKGDRRCVVRVGSLLGPAAWTTEQTSESYAGSEVRAADPTQPQSGHGPALQSGGSTTSRSKYPRQRGWGHAEVVYNEPVRVLSVRAANSSPNALPTTTRTICKVAKIPDRCKVTQRNLVWKQAIAVGLCRGMEVGTA